MIWGFNDLSYKERMKCGLTTLERRRNTGDLIEAYKISLEISTTLGGLFELAPNKATREHRNKLIKKPKGAL